jgi:regulator of PEP synthase PpsR (kinase-PPPase family)
VSDKTPKTTKEMSPAEKARFKKEKTGPKKISYQHRRRKAKKKKS